MPTSRRKFLVTALAAGAVGGRRSLAGTREHRPVFVWSGAALGGEARISLIDADEARARAALRAAADEIERLETIFSLYRDSSELSRLNANCRLDAPSSDLVEGLRAALHWQARTEGAFNPLVQCLWQAAAMGAGITTELLKSTQGPISLRPERIEMPAKSRVTMNGIAQGRIADRVTDILLQYGFRDVVVDAGELRLPGRERRPVGIPALKSAVYAAEVAIATSEPKALVFSESTFRHHLIDPRTGASPRYWESITVFAPTAEMADALSTAFAVLPRDAVGDLAGSLADVAVVGADADGRLRIYGNAKQISQAT